jgi:hypothetical protein
MSLLNVLMRPDYALVGVDTDCANFQDGSHMHVSKMLVLAHIPAVLAGRGGFALFKRVFDIAHGNGGDLDELLAVMPQILYQLAASPAHADRKGFKDELAVVGWSARLNRPLARKFNVSVEREVRSFDIEFATVSPPYWDLSKDPPPFENMEDLVAIAKSQAAYLKERFPEGRQDGRPTSGGGRLIVARISRHGLLIKEKCDLGNLFNLGERSEACSG